MFKSLTMSLCIFASSLAGAKGGLTAVPLSATDAGGTVRTRNSLPRVLGVISDLSPDIKRAAAAFGISPVHIAAAIAGENALNVTALDSLQTYLASRSNYVTHWLSAFEDQGAELFELINSPAYAKCQQQRSDYSFWTCVSNKWEGANRKNFNRYFFNPNGVGATFGVGQMSPVRALMMSDIVARTGLPRLTFRQDGNLAGTYDAIVNPKTVVYYIAASISSSISAYRKAGFDISENPAITTTLYNTGEEWQKASQRAKRGGIPTANDMGRWVKQNIDAIQSAVQ